MKHAFNSKSRRRSAQDIVRKIHDWEEAAAYGGLRFTYAACCAVADNLEAALATACPGVHDDAVFHVFRELARRNMIGAPALIRETAEDITVAFLAAQDGHPGALADTRRTLERRLAYLERHFNDAGSQRELPISVYADMLGDEKAQKRVRAAEKTEYIEHRRTRRGGAHPLPA